MKGQQNNPVIITVANDSYSLPLAAMLKSIEANLRTSKLIEVYVLFNNLSQPIIYEINNCFKKSSIKLNWKKVTHKKLRELKVDGHISIDTYYRLLIEKIFPNFSKVIYLDADIILNACISELWEIDFNGKLLLSVPLASRKSGIVSGERGVPSYNLLKIPPNTRTFNAGVMILNLDEWRKQSISASVLSYLEKFKDYVLWWDQDGLNAMLYDKWGALPPEWNVMTCHLQEFKTWKDSFLSFTEFKKICSAPKLIHFAGPSKPWQNDYKGPYKDVFECYTERLSQELINSFYPKKAFAD